MANSKLKSSTQEREIPNEEDEGFESDDSFCTLDDSDDDPSFEILEEIRSKKVIELDSESEDGDESFGFEIPELDEKDGKCFEKVEELIKDGQVEKLKIEQCKVYLRKYGLRLTGNKAILIERIKEHLEVINGGGEKKYPMSSFVINCKGDACTGDVVMFKQNVYEMFSIVSRSSTGPPCGTRIVAGRIVKESYGAAKQQHTFTIEVLWSRGEKPFPPLHPLLIKGRNLYRLKTMRQRWTNEEERRQVLQEKHSRGFVARSSRETRIKGKETRKMSRKKRAESKNVQPSANQIHAQVVKEQKGMHHENHQHQDPVNLIQTRVLQNQKIQHQQQPYHFQQKENVPKPCEFYHRQPLSSSSLSMWSPTRLQRRPLSSSNRSRWSPTRHQRRPPSSPNRSMRSPTRQPKRPQPRQWCQYYRQGRCYYGESCKYLHE